MREIIRNLIKPQMGKRLFMVIFGQVIMGCGVAVMRLAALGTDPFSAMMLGLTNHTPLSYGTFCALGNVAFFVIEFLLGKKYIGFGTLANWFLLGYFVEMFEWIFRLVGITAPVGIPVRGVVLLLSIVLVALSLSMYQSADIGSSPYDCLAPIMRDRTPIPFFASRVLIDGAAALIAFLAGGTIGVGTIFVFLLVGPITALFNRYVFEKWITTSGNNDCQFGR